MRRIVRDTRAICHGLPRRAPRTWKTLTTGHARVDCDGWTSQIAVAAGMAYGKNMQNIKIQVFWGFVFHGVEHWGGPVWKPIADGSLAPRDFEGYEVSAGELLGARAPSARWGDRDPSDPTDDVYLAFRGWWKEAKKKVEEAGCRFVFFGEEENMFVAVTVQESLREGPAPLDCGLGLQTMNHWEDLLKKFCASTSIEWAKPKWLISFRA